MPARNIGMPLSSRPAEGLYWDPEARGGQGARITTNSMVKTFRRCPKQAEYKYIHRLLPKRLGSPLKRGTWVHALLEAKGKGEDWRKVHAHYTRQFNELFDEEKDYYGDMPREIMTIFKSYLWHYKDDPWEWIDTEFQLEGELPDGTLARGKIDALIRDKHGKLWLVDNKTHKTLPNFNFRLRDTQSGVYLWLAQQNNLEVEGFIWNYLRWKAPTVPKLLQNGKRITDSAVDTDYPTFVTALKKYKAENSQFEIREKDRAYARYLREQRYEYGKLQTSSFFLRVPMEKSADLLERTMQEWNRTSEQLHKYDFLSNPDAIERVPDRSCDFSCNYNDLCAAEFIGGVNNVMRRQLYKVGDPNYYYNDGAGDIEKKEE